MILIKSCHLQELTLTLVFSSRKSSYTVDKIHSEGFSKSIVQNKMRHLQ